MIYEIANLTIKENCELDFEKAAMQARQYFKAAKGCISFKIERCIETPNEYQLVVGWNTLEDHTVTFRESDGFQKWRGLAGPYFAKPPQVKHMQSTIDGFE